ncbi:MAG: diaminopimelate epimerase [Gammaproteobacteria bacterium]|nr:MAG: diaminopimelate epimerase [Gammaproteobacteria bacterium]
MQLPFTKMQALGNDFMLVDGQDRPLPDAATIRRLADRHRGVGFDQLLWLLPPTQPRAAIRYRVFNADGSEAEQCGNGARCVARYVGGTLADGELWLEHASGLSAARLRADGQVRIDMGEPRFDPAAVPFVADTAADAYRLELGAESVELRVVSMGNPHAVLFVPSVGDAPVERLGPLLERHERFPNRANIGFLEVVSSRRARLRVFERGVGETQGCGSGACAAVAAGRRAGRLDAEVRVELPGGEVTIDWPGPGEPMWLTGEAVTVFEGVAYL